MENPCRSFDRSRGPLKKPRLTEDLALNPSSRPFTQRTNTDGPTSALRFRPIDSDIDDMSPGSGAYEPQPVSHHQQQQQQQELVCRYKTTLAELTFNSKPIITNLTIIAGENVHAAKAIATIVYDNILEVFSKAYRQVDPPVHQSMQHHFGTWKGVFPLQTLQVIEKELGFAVMINGSSLGTKASRPDPLSQRPPQSIHVNPKYLEKQRLQQSSRNIAARSSNAIPSSWKNSEEEEFMWEMHSRLSQHDTANISNNSRKDHWIPDVSEKLDFESPIHKAQSILDAVSRFNRETSPDSLSTEQRDKPSHGSWISSAWSLQESHKSDGLPAFSSSHYENYSATIGGLPTAANSSLPRIEMRPQTSSSHFGQQRFQSPGTASPPEQSLMLEPQTHSVPHSDPSQFTGKLDVGSLKHSHQVSSSLISQSSSHYSLSQPPKPDHVHVESSGQIQKPLLSQISGVGTASTIRTATEHSDPLAIGTPESSSTSSLLAAIMKSGILSNNSFIGSLPNNILQDLEQMPSQPSIPSRFLPAIFTSSDSASQDAIATTTNSSQGKAEQLPPSSRVKNTPLQTSDTESKSSIPKSPKRERPTESLNKNLENSTSSASSASSIPSSSDAPRSSTMDEVSFAEPASKSSVASHQSDSIEVENHVGLELIPDVIREFHSSVISGLLDNLPYCCSICGLRLKLRERLNRHLEWHTMKRAEPKGSERALRGWYARSDDWIAGKPWQLVFESTGSVNQSEMTIDETELMVPAYENQYACMLCGELFEDFFSQDRVHDLGLVGGIKMVSSFVFECVYHTFESLSAFILPMIFVTSSLSLVVQLLKLS
ncbi:hypothetical protein GQ457_13G012630 [Hibiscus cannabinus]